MGPAIFTNQVENELFSHNQVYLVLTRREPMPSFNIVLRIQFEAEVLKHWRGYITG